MWVLTKTNVLESGSVYTFIFQVGRNMQFSNITCFGKSRKLCMQGVVYTVAPLEGGHYTELQYMQPSHRLPRQTPKACCHNNLSNSPECRTARKHKQKAITRWRAFTLSKSSLCGIQKIVTQQRLWIWLEVQTRKFLSAGGSFSLIVPRRYIPFSDMWCNFCTASGPGPCLHLKHTSKSRPYAQLMFSWILKFALAGLRMHYPARRLSNTVSSTALTLKNTLGQGALS